MEVQHRGAEAALGDEVEAELGLEARSARRLYAPCDEKAWAGNGLVSEDHAAGQAARAGGAAALALIPGQAMAS